MSLQETRLDALARRLASGGMSRRDAVKLGGAVVAGALGMTQADAWASLTGHCPHHRVYCHGRCCPPGEVCRPPRRKGEKRHCGCPEHKHRCGSKCVDLKDNPKHCGACDHACATGEVCSDGACGTTCSAGQSNCSGACVDLQTDASNCGACGHACGTGAVCISGTCECPSGTTNCSGACVDLQTDFNNCGTCGSKCCNYFANSSCVSGTCQINSCSPDWLNCTGNPHDGCNCLGTNCATATCETPVGC